MSLLRWPGAKTRLLRVLRPYLDEVLYGASEFHDVFLGSAAVLLDVAERHPGIRLYGNDKDGGIAALWGVVLGGGRPMFHLQMMIEDMRPSLDRRAWWKNYSPADPVEWAFQTLFLNRTSFSGNLTGGRIGGAIDSRWNPKRLCDEIGRVHHLLRGRCEISSEDVSACLERLRDRPGAATYADPPYFSVGNQLYREGMTPGEHRALADALRGLSRWVASYDDVPEVRDLYREWATLEPVETTYSVAEAKGSRARRQELVIVPNDQSRVPESHAPLATTRSSGAVAPFSDAL